MNPYATAVTAPRPSSISSLKCAPPSPSVKYAAHDARRVARWLRGELARDFLRGVAETSLFRIACLGSNRRAMNAYARRLASLCGLIPLSRPSIPLFPLGARGTAFHPRASFFQSRDHERVLMLLWLPSRDQPISKKFLASLDILRQLDEAPESQATFSPSPARRYEGPREPLSIGRWIQGLSLARQDAMEKDPSPAAVCRHAEDIEAILGNRRNAL